MTPAMQEGLKCYVRFYETLTPESLKDIAVHFAPDARFKDPFNDVTGTDKIRHVFEDMFQTIGQPQFRVTDTAWSDDDTAYMHWNFTYKVRGKGPLIRVEGVSAITFAPDGRVTSHVDYWDAAQGLYEHLPVIGAVLRWIRSRVEVK